MICHNSAFTILIDKHNCCCCFCCCCFCCCCCCGCCCYCCCCCKDKRSKDTLFVESKNNKSSNFNWTFFFNFQVRGESIKILSLSFCSSGVNPIIQSLKRENKSVNSLTVHYLNLDPNNSIAQSKLKLHNVKVFKSNFSLSSDRITSIGLPPGRLKKFHLNRPNEEIL